MIKGTRNKKTGMQKISPGATRIRKYGEQNSGTNFIIRTSPVFTCSTFKPNSSKYPQGNQTRFLEELDGSHKKTDQETP